MFPVRADKVPLVENGVLAATTNPDQLREWWTRWPMANIALDCAGAGMMVLDLDPGHDPKALDAAVDGLPETGLSQRTPRGGLHLFYALAPGDVVPPSQSKIAPHVDVRSFHSYVLLAPSRTANGSYTWEGEGKPAHRTPGLIAAASAARLKDPDRDHWLIEPDLPENVASAIQWLKSDAKIAVEGHGGDGMAYATAAHLKSFGISEALAFDLMWEHWNPRCIPPWSIDEVDHLRKKVENGHAYNTSPPGNITPAYRVAKMAAVFKPVQTTLPEGREVTAGRFRFVDRDGMETIRPPEWLIPDFLPFGAYAMLVGAPGTFKTFVALDVALSVVTGVDFPWAGCWPRVNNAGPVLFAVGEGRPEFKKRVRAWERQHWNDRRARGLVLSDPVPLVGEEIEPFIEGALALSPDGYRLVVVDTVGRAMQGLNENAQENASAFTRMVERLQHDLGCTVLAIHHTGHDGERARGSSVFGADADTVVFLDRPSRDYVVELRMSKQKDAAEWPGPKFIRMATVDLGAGLNSLVAVPTDAVQVVANAGTRDTKAAVSEAIVADVLDRAVISVLAANKVRAWTTRDLAEALAMRDDIGVSSKTLQNVQLVALRERKDSRARACYDAATRRWKFSE